MKTPTYGIRQQGQNASLNTRKISNSRINSFQKTSSVQLDELKKIKNCWTNLSIKFLSIIFQKLYPKGNAAHPQTYPYTRSDNRIDGLQESKYLIAQNTLYFSFCSASAGPQIIGLC